ncbi:hypothetical protein [Pseudomonas fluorescens]|uniref:Uncharacterized protein n=1 Tax=Pseudomonas fluorescens TaxID=294 RepID=A0A5E7N867_PSEFL|nr:hypothetical protein [Pseudomonas fluorescens]VVP33272.1 hypothetical protein PS880_04452 [Pseudomonas fluorescens]
MKKKIARAKIGSVICSAAKNADGTLVWMLSKNGDIYISQKAVADATIDLAQIRN